MYAVKSPAGLRSFRFHERASAGTVRGIGNGVLPGGTREPLRLHCTSAGVGHICLPSSEQSSHPTMQPTWYQRQFSSGHPALQYRFPPFLVKHSMGLPCIPRGGGTAIEPWPAMRSGAERRSERRRVNIWARLRREQTGARVQSECRPTLGG